MTPSNPQAEATAVLPDGFVARVLEPSPPAIDDGSWFADDPLAASEARADTDADIRVVSPANAGDLTWSELIETNADLAAFARERWLGAYATVKPAPDRYLETLTSLHRLAMAVIAPTRHQANTKFGLRWVRGGFGTPFFAENKQVRVLGDQLVVEQGGSVEEHLITTITEAARMIGSTVDTETAAEHDSPAIGDINEPLLIDRDHARFVSEWWGLGTAALEIVRSDAATVNPGRPQLWPGHFDVGIEFGSENARASFGASPGDHHHPEPYLYVGPWYPDRLNIAPDEFWNGEGFTGARLMASELVGVDNPVEAAVAFYTKGRDLLAASEQDQEQE